jgi:hypothetical protein
MASDQIINKDFHQHRFDRLVDLIDKGDEVHKIYECQCGFRMIEVFVHVAEQYE